MISICIPIYNFDIASLIEELSKQIKQLDVPCEVICIDDASEKRYKKINKESVTKAVYIQLENNIGRAAIRNLFLQYSHYENLLFLDCDSIITDAQFLSNYIKFINQNKNYNVVCGGRIYSEKSPEKKYKLRWLYGKKKESLPVDERNKNPNASFQTNNFIISKSIFLQTHFDDRLTNYGHEDTLLGYALQKQNIIVHHINNPVLNGHLESNKAYLAQTEKAVINLTLILLFVNYDEAFISNVSLLQFYYKTKWLQPFISKAFSVLKPVIEWLLSNGYISLSLFNFYKLGILANNIKTKPATINNQ